MNKRKFLAVLSIPAIAASLGLAVPNMIDNAQNNTNIKLTLQKEIQDKTNYVRKIPKTWIEKGEFEYLGLKYKTLDNRYFTNEICDKPESVKDLYLADELFFNCNLRDDVDWSRYTNLENVIICNKGKRATIYNILSKLPSGINLYIGGYPDYTNLTAANKFQNIYFCPQISYSEGIFTNAQNYLGQSAVKNIYYNDYIEQNMKSDVDNLISSNPINKNSEVISIQKISQNIKFPKELFFMDDKFTSYSNVFGAETKKKALNIFYTSRKSLMESIVTIDSRVHDLYINNCTLDISTLPKNRKYGKICFETKIDMSSFESIEAEEISFHHSQQEIDLNALGKVDAIRFLSPTVPTSIVVGTLPVDSTLKKIYVPNDLVDSWKTYLSGKNVDTLIEGYDLITYQAPFNSYIDDKGTKIYVEDPTYSISDIEFQKQALEAMGIDVTGQVIDRLAKEYEVLHRSNNESSIYTINDIKTLVVSKNKDAKEFIRDLLVYNVRQGDLLCDIQGFTVKSIDDTNYQVGANGSISVIYTLPNNREFKQSIIVKTIPTICEESYAIDADNNITVLTPISTIKNNLSKMMKPIMEDYFMEINPQYTESQVLDTTKLSYNCGNTYSVTSKKGKVRVATFENNTASTPEQKPDGAVPDPKPETGTTPESGQGPVTQDNDPNVNTDGLVLNEVIAVYTNTKLDGVRVLDQLRNQILTYQGKPLEWPFGISYTNENNDKDFSFNIFGTVLNKDYLKRTINVKISNYNKNLAFVLFEDGKLIVAQNYKDNYTVDEIKAGVEEFLRTQNIDATNVVVPTYDGTTDLYGGGSYSGGELLFLNSGPTLTFTNANRPMDDSVYMQGYKGINDIIYTDNYTEDDVLRALSKSFLLKDGVYVTSKYKVNYKYTKGSVHVGYEIVDENNNKIHSGAVTLRKVKSNYKYILGAPFGFDHCCLLLDKVSTKPTYTLNEVLKDAISQFRGLMSPFDNQTNIDFTIKGHVDVDGVYKLGNGSYYKYQYDVDVVDLNYLIKTNDCTINGVAQAGLTTNEKVNNFFQNIKEKFIKNKAFKIISITVGSITGLLLLYGAYILIRKSIKWFKK